MWQPPFNGDPEGFIKVQMCGRELNILISFIVKNRILIGQALNKLLRKWKTER